MNSSNGAASPLASQTLLAAALVGLLGVTSGAACDDAASPTPGVTAGQGGAAGGAGGPAGSGGSASGAGGEGGATAGSGGAGGEAGAPGVITSTKQDPDMTAEKFKAMCDEAGGAFEVHPHCGGANSCKGFSYDQTTHTFTEHTCKGLNTCTGFSCVLP